MAIIESLESEISKFAELVDGGEITIRGTSFGPERMTFEDRTFPARSV